MDINDIIYAVSRHTGISKHTILKYDRHRGVADSRMMVYYLLHTLCGMNFSAIGRRMKRTHAAVFHGINEVNIWVDETRPRDHHTKHNCEIIKRIISELKE